MRKKYLLFAVLFVFLVVGAYVVYITYFSESEVPPLAEDYVADGRALSPSFWTECPGDICQDPDTEGLMNCCTERDAIESSDPQKCTEITDDRVRSNCYAVASWAHVENCLEYKDKSDVDCGLQTTVLAAYSRDSEEEELWRWCLQIPSYIETGETYDSAEHCLAGAAYYEKNPSICDNLNTEEQSAACRNAAEYLIEMLDD